MKNRTLLFALTLFIANFCFAKKQITKQVMLKIFFTVLIRKTVQLHSKLNMSL